MAPSALPAAPSGLTATVVSSSEIDLAWTNNSGSGTTIQVQRATNSAFTQNVSLVMTTAANATSCASTGLTANTTYYYRAWANDSAGNSVPSNTATAATPVATALPAGWSDADIGGPSPAGSATFLPSPSGGGAGGRGVYTVTGGGADIWNAADQFNFASQSASGDQTLIARVPSLGDTNAWSKAGVMFRDSLPSPSGGGAGVGHFRRAPCVAALATPSEGVTMQWRNATGGISYNVAIGGIAAPTASNPVWLKLVKSGSNYAGYYSLNGSTWALTLSPEYRGEGKETKQGDRSWTTFLRPL